MGKLLFLGEVIAWGANTELNYNFKNQKKKQEKRKMTYTQEKIQENIEICKKNIDTLNNLQKGYNVDSSAWIALLAKIMSTEKKLKAYERLLKPCVSFEELKQLLANDNFFTPFKIVEKGSYLLVKKGNSLISKIQLVASYNAFLDTKENFNTLFYTDELIESIKSRIEFSRQYGNPNY